MYAPDSCGDRLLREWITSRIKYAKSHRCEPSYPSVEIVGLVYVRYKDGSARRRTAYRCSCGFESIRTTMHRHLVRQHSLGVNHASLIIRDSTVREEHHGEDGYIFASNF